MSSCLCEELEVSLSAHAGRPKIGLDDEYWNFVLLGDHNWPLVAGLDVYDVIATRAAINPPVKLKNSGES